MSLNSSSMTSRKVFVVSAAFLLSVVPVFGQASAPTPVKGYNLSVFRDRSDRAV